MVWQSALSLALSLSRSPNLWPDGSQVIFLTLCTPVLSPQLSPSVACAAILLVQSLQAPFPLVRPTFCNPILLLTACFPLSSHTPSLFSCVSLVLSTSDARLSWFSCPTFSCLAHSTYSTLTFLMPDIPSHLPFFVHTFRIFAMPALPRPAPYSICPPLASPRLAPPRPALIGPPPLDFPPLLSPRLFPCGLTLVGLTLSALVLESRHRVTLSGTFPYTLSSHDSHAPFPLSSRLPHFTPASPSCLACPSLSFRMSFLVYPSSSAPDARPSRSSCMYFSRSIHARHANPSSHPAVASPPPPSHPHGPDSGQSSEPFGNFIHPMTDVLRADKAKASTDTNVEFFRIASTKKPLPS